MNSIQKIKYLDELDSKLLNRIHFAPNAFEEKYSHLGLKPSAKKTYSVFEENLMHSRKSDLISSLHKDGLIEETEYEKWLLSETFEFTPKIKIP